MKHPPASIVVALLLVPLSLAVLAGCKPQERPPDVEKQVLRLRGDSDEEIYKALKNLQSLGDGALPALADLRTLLGRTKDPDLQAEIAKTLGAMGPAAGECVPDLLALLGRKEMWPRYCAVEALGRMGPAGAKTIPKLMPLVRDKDQDVAAAAVEAIRRLKRSAGKR